MPVTSGRSARAAVAAALIAAREEQRRRLVAERREDQGSAVAALAEGLGRGALDLDLAVEAEIALVVADHEVVELEGRDAPARMAGGAPDLLDEVDLRGGRGGRARQGAHTGERGRLVRDLRIESGQGTVHEVHPRRLELHEPVQGADAVERALSAVVGAGLEDGVPGLAAVLVGEDVVVGEDAQRAALPQAHERAQRARRDLVMAHGEADEQRPLARLLPRPCLLHDVADVAQVHLATRLAADAVDLTRVLEPAALDAQGEAIVPGGGPGDAQGQRARDGIDVLGGPRRHRPDASGGEIGGRGRRHLLEELSLERARGVETHRGPPRSSIPASRLGSPAARRSTQPVDSAEVAL